MTNSSAEEIRTAGQGNVRHAIATVEHMWGPHTAAHFAEGAMQGSIESIIRVRGARAAFDLLTLQMDALVEAMADTSEPSGPQAWRRR